MTISTIEEGTHVVYQVLRVQKLQSFWFCCLVCICWLVTVTGFISGLPTNLGNHIPKRFPKRLHGFMPNM